MRFLAVMAVAAIAGTGARAQDKVAPAQEQTELSSLAKTIAGDVQTYLKNKNETAVTLGEFVYKGRGQASAGPLVRQHFEDAFKARGIDVKLVSNVRISGEFAEKDDDGRTVLVITTEVIRFKPQDKLLLPLTLANNDVIAVLLGLNVLEDDRFRPGGDGKPDGIGGAIENPRFTTTGNVIRAGKGSPFGIEICVAPGKPVKTDRFGNRSIADYTVNPPENKDGYAFVPIKRDEVYGVTLINEANFDAAVELRIDGLSMYSFSAARFRDAKTNQPIYSKVIVPKKSRTTIRGWHVTNNESNEFLVTSYAKSAAAELKSTAPTGTITATFHAAWGLKEIPPPGEAVSTNVPDGTGKGDQFKQKFQEVERTVGKARDVISVRYTK